MSMIQVSLQHNTTLDDAKFSLENAIVDIRKRFGAFVKDVTWSDDRSMATLSGRGIVLEFSVDAVHVRVQGDIPLLGRMLGTTVGKKLSDGLRLELQSQFPHGVSEPL